MYKNGCLPLHAHTCTARKYELQADKNVLMKKLCSISIGIFGWSLTPCENFKTEQQLIIDMTKILVELHSSRVSDVSLARRESSVWRRLLFALGTKMFIFPNAFEFPSSISEGSNASVRTSRCDIYTQSIYFDFDLHLTVIVKCRPKIYCSIYFAPFISEAAVIHEESAFTNHCKVWLSSYKGNCKGV